MQRPAEHLRSRRRLTVSWPSVARGIQQMPSRTARSGCSRLRELSWLLTGGAALLGAWPQGVRADAALEEVVVTAERRSEKAQDVPLAITAVSAADLESRGVRQAGDITADVPNMLLHSPYGPEAQPTFTLRGVTTQDFSENQSSPVAMYVDEVYKSVGAVQALQTYDLDRVEVLRGPQGTLYGKKDRKSTRLNSSHSQISYAVFCLKKKK